MSSATRTTKHKHTNQSAKHHTTTNIITTVSHTLYNRTSWTTQHALSSNDLPIITTISIRHDFSLQQNRRTFTSYKKADWTQFTEDYHTHKHTHKNIILMADNQKSCRLLPDHIVCKITQRNNIRRAIACDSALKLINEEKIPTYKSTNKTYGRNT